MLRNRSVMLLYSVALLVAGAGLGRTLGAPPTLDAQMKGRVFELRTYTAPDGKLERPAQALPRPHAAHLREARHDQHRLLDAGGRAAVAEHDGLSAGAPEPRRAARQNWKEFASDPEWKKVASESQVNGPLTSKIESVFLDPTDYSPMK